MPSQWNRKWEYLKDEKYKRTSSRTRALLFIGVKVLQEEEGRDDSMTFALSGGNLDLIVQDHQFNVDVQFRCVDLDCGQMILCHLNCVPVQQTKKYNVRIIICIIIYLNSSFCYKKSEGIVLQGIKMKYMCNINFELQQKMII